MLLEFDWDPTKAESNRRKHGVVFDEAIGVFADPMALSRPDEAEGHEERWITLGLDRSGRPLLVVHTYSEIDADRARIRIISARRPTRRELRQYETM